MNSPSYLIVLLECQYLTQLEMNLRARMQLLKQAIKANQYDVNANRELPLVKADHKEINELLLSYSNVINCRLQDVYKFQFQSIKVAPLPEQTENQETVDSEEAKG